MKSFSPSPILCKKILSNVMPPPLAVGHAPNMFCQPPGASITQANFYQPCAEAAFLSRIKLPKVWGQHLMHHSSPPKKRPKKKWSAVNYFWIGHHRSFARSTKRFWSSDPDLSINQNQVHFTRKNWDLPFRKKWDSPVHQPNPGGPQPTQSNDKCGFYNYFSQLLTGLPTVLMNHRLAAIVC